MPPILLAVSALAGTAFSIGDTLYQQANAPGQNPTSTASTSPTQAQLVAQETQNRQQQASAVQQQLPGLQAQTDGGVSPGYLADMGSLLSGQSQLSGSPQIAAAVSSFLGNNGAGSSSGSLSSLLPGLTGGSSGGGSSGSSAIGQANAQFMQPNQQDSSPFSATAFAQ